MPRCQDEEIEDAEDEDEEDDKPKTKKVKKTVNDWELINDAKVAAPERTQRTPR